VPATRRAAIAVIALCPLLTGCGVLSLLTEEAPRDDAGQVTASANAGALTLRVGDCIANLDLLSSEFESAPVVPCDQPHQAEVYAERELEGDLSQPANLDDQADEFCFGEVEGFLGGAPGEELADLEVISFTPTKEGWVMGDHKVPCVVAGASTEALTGTLRGRAG